MELLGLYLIIGMVFAGMGLAKTDVSMKDMAKELPFMLVFLLLISVLWPVAVGVSIMQRKNKGGDDGC